jgi:hypothetical protein
VDINLVPVEFIGVHSSSWEWEKKKKRKEKGRRGDYTIDPQPC